MYPEIPLPPKPILTRWGTWLEAVEYYAEHIDSINNVLLALDSEDAVSIDTAKTVTCDISVKNDLAHIQHTFSCIIKTLKSLQNRHLSLSESFEIINSTVEQLNRGRGKVADAVRAKVDTVLSKNPGYEELQKVVAVMSGESTVKINLDLSPADIVKLNYVPVTSCDVERSFSQYKSILRDNRRRFTFQHLKEMFVTYCYVHINPFPDDYFYLCYSTCTRSSKIEYSQAVTQVRNPLLIDEHTPRFSKVGAYGNVIKQWKQASTYGTPPIYFSYIEESHGSNTENGKKQYKIYTGVSIGTLSTMENLQQILQAIAEMKAELKNDISEVKKEMKSDTSEVKTEMKSDISEVKGDISGVKGDISEVKDDVTTQIESVSAHVDGIVAIVNDELKADLDKLNQNFTTINETVAELRQDVDHFDGKIRDLERRQEQTSEVMYKHAEENKHILALMDQHAVENKHILALVDRQGREYKQIVAEEVRRAMQEAATELRAPYSGPAEPSPSARHYNVKTPKFDGTTSWAIFRRQFEAIAEHNGWTPAAGRASGTGVGDSSQRSRRWDSR
ncbi:hypothetical protein ANN_03278 [Periplaneta americana]|uniref:Uncharacterized protein n=1 Tax=Periplaneta americana TaxID=6978 RepID=A0ABQ8U2K7_PERAM|nr:hypothetical protein ANN_03278 [Periplaneta americana]